MTRIKKEKESEGERDRQSEKEKKKEKRNVHNSIVRFLVHQKYNLSYYG